MVNGSNTGLNFVTKFLLEGDKRTVAAINKVVSSTKKASAVTATSAKESLKAKKAEEERAQALLKSGKALGLNRSQTMKLVAAQQRQIEKTLLNSVAYDKNTNSIIKLTAAQRISRGMWTSSFPVLDRVNKSLNTLRWTTVNIGFALLAIGGAIAPIILLARESVILETAMANVRKTTDFTRDQISSLAGELLTLSKITPLAAVELAEIAAVAGQIGLGVQGPAAISAFTSVISMMAVATELTAEQSAKSLAKIAQAFNVPISNINNLGSVINELSNTTAANSSEIVSSLLKVGSAASNLGLSVDFVAALQATLIAAGQSAARAGTRMRRALAEINSDIRGFAELTGTSFEEFGNLLETDANKALLLVLSSLRDISSATERSAEINERFSSAAAFSIQTLVNNYDELAVSVGNASREIVDGTSLLIETGKATDTVASQFALLKNVLKEPFISEDGLSLLKKTIAGFRSVAGDAFLPLGSDELDKKKQFEVLGTELAELAAAAGLSENAVTDLFDIIKDQPTGVQQLEQLQRSLLIFQQSVDASLEEFEKLSSGLSEADPLFARVEQVTGLVNSNIAEFGKILPETAAEVRLLNAALLEQKTVFDLAGKQIATFRESVDNLRGLGDIGIEDFTKAFSGFFTLGLDKFDILRNKAESFFTVMEVEGRNIEEDFGFSPDALLDYIDALEQMENKSSPAIEAVKNRIEDLESANSSLANSIRSVSDAISRQKDVLSGLKSELKDVNDRIKLLSDLRFEGETDFSRTISSQELVISKQKLAALGVTDVQSFIQDSINGTADSFDNVAASIDGVTAATANSQDTFKAWQLTVREQIRALISESDDLARDTTSAVRANQTLLLSTSRFSGSSPGATEGGRSEDEIQLERLKLAQDVFFGSMRDQVNFAIQDDEDRTNGVASGADIIITSLDAEFAKREVLLSQIANAQDNYDTLRDRLKLLQMARDSNNVAIEQEKVLLDSLIASINEIAASYLKAAEARNGFGDAIDSGFGDNLVGFGAIEDKQASRIDAQFGSGFADAIKSNNLTPIQAFGKRFDDFVMRPGQKPASFSSDDTLVGVKDASSLGGVTVGDIIVSGVGGDPQQIADSIVRTIKRDLLSR